MRGVCCVGGDSRGLRQRRSGTRDEVLLRLGRRHLANPVGTSSLRTSRDGEAARKAATNFQKGGSLFEEVSSHFDEVFRFAASELGYVLQVERHEGRVAGHDDTVVTALRATLVFRPEDGVWKIAHRHANPITSTRPLNTLLQS